jgi:hypothetical protein
MEFLGEAPTPLYPAAKTAAVIPALTPRAAAYIKRLKLADAIAELVNPSGVKGFINPEFKEAFLTKPTVSHESLGKTLGFPHNDYFLSKSSVYNALRSGMVRYYQLPPDRGTTYTERGFQTTPDKLSLKTVRNLMLKLPNRNILTTLDIWNPATDDFSFSRSMDSSQIRPETIDYILYDYLKGR